MSDLEYCIQCGNFALVVVGSAATCGHCGNSFTPLHGCPALNGGPCLRACGCASPGCRKLRGETAIGLTDQQVRERMVTRIAFKPSGSMGPVPYPKPGDVA